MKFKKYILIKNVLFNSKKIKIKGKLKLENLIFRWFYILYYIKKEIHNLELF